MPAVTIHIAPLNQPRNTTTANVLPDLLETPSGLAIIEIQGTINTSTSTNDEDNASDAATRADVGRLEFPLYDSNNTDDGNWTKKVYLYVGKYQRLTGEVKRLAKPLAIVRKRQSSARSDSSCEELEICDVVRYKILFSGRPEPVGCI